MIVVSASKGTVVQCVMVSSWSSPIVIFANIAKKNESAMKRSLFFCHDERNKEETLPMRQFSIRAILKNGSCVGAVRCKKSGKSAFDGSAPQVHAHTELQTEAQGFVFEDVLYVAAVV